MNEWLGIGIVTATFSALLGGLYLIQRTCGLDPEPIRKLFHLGGGLIALIAPWLFTDRWPPVLLAALLTLALLTVRWVRALHDTVGDVLYSVGRESLGEIWFPLGVGTVLLLADGRTVSYVVPTLVLALADPVAAVFGSRYGSKRFRVLGGHKSVAGSMAFFVSAFLCASIPLIALAKMEFLQAFTVATTLGLFLTITEASVSGGADNFLIPVAGFVFLRILLTLGFGAQMLLLATMVIIVVAASPIALKHLRYVEAGTALASFPGEGP